MNAVTHPACGIRWHQAGNRTGHCSACHRTFSGVSTFDAHQRLVDGRTVCLNPAMLLDRNGSARFRTFVDGEGCTVWRSAAEMPGNLWDQP